MTASFENGCSGKRMMRLKGVLGLNVWRGVSLTVAISHNSNVQAWKANSQWNKCEPKLQHVTFFCCPTGFGKNLLMHINLPPLFQPSIGVRPMPTERIQHSAMMPFALVPVTRLLYLKCRAEHIKTLGLVVLSNFCDALPPRKAQDLVIETRRHRLCTQVKMLHLLTSHSEI